MNNDPNYKTQTKQQVGFAVEAKEVVRDIAERQHVQSALDKLTEIEQTPTIKIGFIGEFSSGKTSLINSILGTTLPVDINPTTKSICLIEPSPGTTIPQYFEIKNGEKQTISFLDFEAIVGGEKNGVAGITVSPCEVLPEGCIFVDTPGINTPSGTEEDLTFLFLSSLDAAVFCINVGDGSITKDAEEFLCSNELKLIQDRIIFALTWSDRKNEDAINSIKQSIVNQIHKLNEQRKVCIHNIEQKIIAVSSKQDGNAEKVYSFLKKIIFGNKESAYADRRNQELKKCAADLIEVLKVKSDSLNCDSSEIDKRITDCKDKIDRIQSDLSRRQDALFAFREELTGKVYGIMNAYSLSIQNAKSEVEMDSVIQNMMNDLLELLNMEAKRFASSATIPPSVLSALSTELVGRLGRIDKVRDASVTVATAVVTALILPGASAAAEAGEAAAGAGVKAAGSIAAKETAKAGAKTAMRATVAAAADSAANEAAKTTAQTTAQKFFGFLGQIIHDVNPLEHVGDFTAQYIKGKSFDEFASVKASLIASNVCTIMEKPYQDEVIRPLEENLETERKTLEQLKGESEQDIQNHIKTQKAIDQDIRTLRNLFNP